MIDSHGPASMPMRQARSLRRTCLWALTGLDNRSSLAVIDWQYSLVGAHLQVALPGLSPVIWAYCCSGGIV
jgi:hypothetical protein